MAKTVILRAITARPGVSGAMLVAWLVGCEPVRAPVTPAIYVTNQASSSAAVNATETPDEGAPAEPAMSAASRSVLVLIDKHVDRPTEVLAVFDFHSAANSEDKGFDELRVRAQALGADAVIGAEFEHGDDGGPSHLSGMAVRFLDH